MSAVFLFGLIIRGKDVINHFPTLDSCHEGDARETEIETQNWQWLKDETRERVNGGKAIGREREGEADRAH